MTLTDLLIIIAITWFCIIPAILLVVMADLIHDWIENILRKNKKYDE